jgi:mRNA interferase MazF
VKRGEIYYVVPPRDFGKQRPAVVIQSPLFLANAPTVTFCLMTGSVQFVNPMRILVKPTKRNGLDQPSLIQVDKIITVDAERIRNRMSSIPPTHLATLDAALNSGSGCPNGLLFRKENLHGPKVYPYYRAGKLAKIYEYCKPR